jgi:putative FmdB family regulatory protein
VPLYDFRCRSCGERFEEFAPPAQTAPCPACGSTEVERVLSAFAGPFTTAPRGLAARRSNAQRRVREEQRAERKAEREARRKELGEPPRKKQESRDRRT